MHNATLHSPPPIAPRSTYVKFCDPGHGWVKVAIAECRALGIYDQVSVFSYRRGDNLYLEEDADAALWVEAWREHDVDVAPRVDIQHSNRESRIRSYEHFQPTSP